ncbi:Core Sm protein Sm G, spliceosomal U1, U2, U4, and U5 snRNPs component [Savitreella phatthalungensis]
MAGKPTTPELKKFMDKELLLQLNGKRRVVGTLRGYDVFLNLVLDNAYEQKGDDAAQRESIGQVVIRGNSIVMMEALERI